MMIRRGTAIFVRKKEMWGWIHTFSENSYYETFLTIDVNYIKRRV